MLFLHLPDEKRVGHFAAIVGELLHLSDLLMHVFGNLHSIVLYALVAFETKTYELVVLSEYLSCRA